jgi:Ca2+-binding RTX toxin-like protein
MGTDGNDSLSVASGTSGTLVGGDGNDILTGDAGNDILWGNAGDDTMEGKGGADTFKAAEGNDTITDYDQSEGDVVDISHVFDDAAGDKLAVSENPDGSVKLSVLDSSDVEKGSVTFADIDYDVDLTSGDELNSLLGQVDVDDGTV